MDSDYIKINNIRFNIRIDNSISPFYFIEFEPCMNGFLFQHFSINKEEFSKSILNYYHGGAWPFCNNKEDCLKLLFALLDKIKLQYGAKVEISLIKSQEENCWND